MQHLKKSANNFFDFRTKPTFFQSSVRVRLDDAAPHAMAGTSPAPPGAPPSDAAALLPTRMQPLDVATAPKHGATDSWLSGTMHVTAAVIGVGVLGLPRAVAELGWGAGVAVLGVCLALSLHTALLLARAPGHATTYAGLAAPLGPRAAAAVGASQVAACAGLSVAYTITAGASAAALLPGGALVWTLVFGLLQIPIAILAPDFHALRPVSLIGTAASFFYVVAAAATSAAAARTGPPPPPVTGGSALARVSALGTIGFSFGGHYVVAGVRGAVRRAAITPAVLASYLCVALSYISVAVTGVLAYGGAVADDVLLSAPVATPSPPGVPAPAHAPRSASDWVVAAANAAVVFHVSAGLQLFSQAPFEACANLMGPWAGRAVYCGAVTAVAAALPFFGEVMSLVGASLFLPATFVLPHVFHVAAGAAGSRLEAGLCVLLAGVCSIVSVAATIAALIQLGEVARQWWS